MKLLYPLIILFAFSFADVVTFKHRIFFIPYETTKEDVIFIGITDDINNPKGAFNYDIDRYGEIIPRAIYIDCDKIISIKDDFMNDISFDCGTASILKDDKNRKTTYAPFLIGLSGVVGLIATSIECDDLNDLEDCLERREKLYKISYVLLAMGGFGLGASL
jgi:hypothetical protein